MLRCINTCLHLNRGVCLNTSPFSCLTTYLGLFACSMFLWNCGSDSVTRTDVAFQTMRIALYNPRGYSVDSVTVNFDNHDIETLNSQKRVSKGDSVILSIAVQDRILTDSLQLEVKLFSHSLSIGTLSYHFLEKEDRFSRTSLEFRPMVAHVGLLLNTTKNLPPNLDDAIAQVVGQALVAKDSAFIHLADSTPPEISSTLVIAYLNKLAKDKKISTLTLDSLLAPMVSKSFWAMQWRAEIDSAQAGSSQIALSDFFAPYLRMGRFEITQAQYATVMGEAMPPSSLLGSPIRSKNFYEAALFCNALTKLDAQAKDTFYTYSSVDSTNGYLNDFKILSDSIGLDNFGNMRLRQGYRLPTEEEWIAAYYWDTKTDNLFFWGDDSTSSTLSLYSNWNLTDIIPVGSRQPNRHGLFDMNGNVAEWSQSADGWIESLTSIKYLGGSYRSATATPLSPTLQLTPVKFGVSAVQEIGWRVVKIEEQRSKE